MRGLMEDAKDGVGGWDPRAMWSRIAGGDQRTLLMRGATAVSVLWLGALGAFAFGFLNRAAETEMSGRFLPTLDLLFFVFAVAGPLAMLWIVVLALSRADRLAESVAAQGDSALALAATLGNLTDSVDELNRVTLHRLDALPMRVDKVLLESTMLIDQRMADRLDRVHTMVETTSAQIDAQIGKDLKELGEAVGVEREALATLRDELAQQIANAMSEARVQMDTDLTDLRERTEQGLADARNRVDQGLADTMSRQVSGVADGDELVRGALEALSHDVAQKMDAQLAAIETKVGTPMRLVQAQIEAMSGSVTANPPATSAELAVLLGETAAQHVAPERAAIGDALNRIEALEKRSADMLAQIDRTSRLNPLMEPVATAVGPVLEPADDGIELPFDALPRATARTDLNWKAVVRILDGIEPSRGTRQALTKAGADPDVARVARLRDEVTKALSDERIFLKDITIDAVHATTWARFAEGARGGDVAVLGAAVQDDVACALVRARLRNDPEFHALGLRLIGAYGDLVARAATALGPDPILAEMGDTATGRAVVLLGSVLRIFDSPAEGA